MKTLILKYIVIGILLVVIAPKSNAQIYVLKDHRDTIIPNYLYDTLPELCDSFFYQLKFEDIASIRKFVPTVNHLKTTYDSLDVDYNDASAIYRQQMVQRKLELQYKRLLKRARSDKLNFKRLELAEQELNYGKDDKGNEFCFVTLHCKRNKRTYAINFTAIKLNGKWFIGDDLMMHKT